MKRYFSERLIVYLLGVIIMSFGVALSVEANIGVAPGSTVSYATSKLTPLSVGWCTSLFNVFWVLLQLAVTRRFELKLLLQFPLAYVFGRLIDFYLSIFRLYIPNPVFNYLYLIAGLLIFSLGIRLIVGADILLVPPDAFARAVGNVFGWPMSKSKLVFDVVVTAVSALLMLVFSGDVFSVVGPGTVICAAGTGPAIGLYTKLLPLRRLAKPGNR